MTKQLRSLLPLLALAGACAREAPGPPECERFALRSVGVERSALAVPRVRQAVEELVRRCLTTPYDRKLIGCVEESGPARRCFLEFERRRKER